MQVRVLILRHVFGSSELLYIQVSPTDVDTHPQIVDNQHQLHITGLGQVALSLLKQQTKNSYLEAPVSSTNMSASS